MLTLLRYGSIINKLQLFENASNEYKTNGIWDRGLDPLDSQPFFPTVNLFRSNRTVCYRIPSVVSYQSNIIVFTEARIGSCSDCNKKGIVYKKSYDSGESWSSEQWLVKPNEISGNPTAIFDSSMSKIILHYVVNQNDSTNCVLSDYLYQVESFDMGETWTTPKSLNLVLGKYQGSLVGPGNGVVLDTGRYLFPAHYLTADRQGGGVIIYYSDDRGKSYQLSNTFLIHMDEASIIPLYHNNLVVHMRNAHNTNCKCRAISFSQDAGTTWSSIKYENFLKDPICQGCGVQIGDYASVIHPNMYYSRSNLTLSIFKNENFQFVKQIRITDEFEFSGYSSVSPFLVKDQFLIVVWEGCHTNIPFRVWCAEDIGWSIKITWISNRITFT